MRFFRSATAEIEKRLAAPATASLLPPAARRPPWLRDSSARRGDGCAGDAARLSHENNGAHLKGAWPSTASYEPGRITR